MDKLSSQQRHANMAAIRSKNTKPEMIVRHGLWKRGFRYRLNHKRLPGHPDLVLRKYRTCIFVNGCFWHKHDCPRFVWPSSNQEYWIPKIQTNVDRDIRNYAMLQDNGWHVILVWECELKRPVAENRLLKLVNEIKEGNSNGTDQSE